VLCSGRPARRYRPDAALVERHWSTRREASRIVTVTEAGRAGLRGVAWPRSGRTRSRLTTARATRSGPRRGCRPLGCQDIHPTIFVIAASNAQNAQLWTASALAGTQPTCAQITATRAAPARLRGPSAVLVNGHRPGEPLRFPGAIAEASDHGCDQDGLRRDLTCETGRDRAAASAEVTCDVR